MRSEDFRRVGSKGSRQKITVFFSGPATKRGGGGGKGLDHKEKIPFFEALTKNS